MGRARILPGQDTRSRGVSRRIDERITGYTQSAGFEGCMESWMCACAAACARGPACARGLDYGSREEAISEIPGEADSPVRGVVARHRIVEKSKSRGSIVFSNSCFRGWVLGTIFRILFGIFFHHRFRAVSNCFSELFDASLSSLNNLSSLVFVDNSFEKRKSRFERCRCQARIEVFINFLNFLILS